METKGSISFSILKGSRQMPTRMTRALLQTGRAGCLPGTPWNTQPAGGAAQHLRAHQEQAGMCQHSPLSAETCTWTHSCWSASHSHSTSNKREALLSEPYQGVRRGRGATAHLRHHTSAARIRQGGVSLSNNQAEDSKSMLTLASVSSRLWHSICPGLWPKSPWGDQIYLLRPGGHRGTAVENRLTWHEKIWLAKTSRPNFQLTRIQIHTWTLLKAKGFWTHTFSPFHSRHRKKAFLSDPEPSQRKGCPYT